LPALAIAKAVARSSSVAEAKAEGCPRANEPQLLTI